VSVLMSFRVRASAAPPSLRCCAACRR
jgi:hypothetical protein